MRNGILMAAFLMFYVGPVYGQTISDLEKKYGKPIYAYDVSQHIWMTPQYSATGDLCEARLYPKRIGSAHENYVSASSLPFQELIEVLNQLVPLNTRGYKVKTFGITATGGGAAWTTYTYEKVEFIFISTFQLKSDSYRPLKPYVFSEQKPSLEAKTDMRVPSDQDFVPAQAWSTEMVTVKWSNRKCNVE